MTDTHKSTMDIEKDIDASRSASRDSTSLRNHDEATVPGDFNDVPLNTAQDAGQTKSGPPADPPQRSKGRIAIIMFALGMAVFLAALDITIITTALPTISQHFHSSSGYLWIGAAYQLAAAASTPLWGKISDIWGRKPILLIANVIFFVGSLVAALSNSIGMLIAARAIQGWGGGGLLTLVNISIGDLFSMRSRGLYYGVVGMVWAIASALGPIIGGAFTEKVTWRWCFYINLPLDGIAFFIIFFFLDLHTPTTDFAEGLKTIDWSGAALVVGGTLMLLFGLEFGGVTDPWDSATVICLIVFGFVTLVLFGINEWRFATYPIMPMRIFKHLSNCAAIMVCFLHSIVFIAGSYFLPLYFQASRGKSPLMSGVLVLPYVLGLSLTAMGTGIFIRKTGQYLPPIWAGLTVMTLGVGLLIDLDSHSSWAKVVLYQLVYGMGTGPLFQGPLIALQSLVQPQDIGVATATFAFTRNLGTSISIVIGGVVYQNEMLKKAGQLTRELGPEIAARVGGNNAAANTPLIDSLPSRQKAIVQAAVAKSLQPGWIMYTAFSGVAILISLLITKQVLSKTHQETKVGIEAEREKARDAAEARAARKASVVKAPNGRVSEEV